MRGIWEMKRMGFFFMLLCLLQAKLVLRTFNYVQNWEHLYIKFLGKTITPNKLILKTNIRNYTNNLPNVLLLSYGFNSSLAFRHIKSIAVKLSPKYIWPWFSVLEYLMQMIM